MGLEVALEGKGLGAGIETDYGFNAPGPVFVGVMGLSGIMDGEAVGKVGRVTDVCLGRVSDRAEDIDVVELLC
jgi:hypothetical protein